MTTLFSDAPKVVDSNRILYTPSSFARSSLLHLQEVGELRALQPHTSRRSNLSSYLFFTVISGAGKLKYGGKEYPLATGSCVFIDCQQPYSHTTDNNLWTLRWIHFNGSTMPSIYQKYISRGGRPTFSPSYLDAVYSIHDDLMKVAGSDDYMRDMLINQHLSSLLVEVMKESWHPEEQMPPKRGGISEVHEYLNTHYNEKITVDDLAGKFLISTSYLAHNFKEQYGQSITAFLLSTRITKAKQMLRFTDEKIEEIGYKVGIGAPAYFSRVFKEIEGVTPSTYREQW